MTEIVEAYRKLGEDDSFDIVFWQKQGDEAIFKAAEEMVLDALIIKGQDVTEPRLQKSIEHFGKI